MMWQHMAYIKELEYVCSINPYQLKVIQSNLNITDIPDSNCTNFKATRQKATIKHNWVFTEIITDPSLPGQYKCLKSLSLEQILTPFRNEFRPQMNPPILVILKIKLT